MADIAELRVRLTADASGFKAVLAEAQSTVARTGGVFSTLRDTITPLNQGIELLKTTFGSLVGIAERLGRAFEAPVAAAAEQDRALAGLEATLGTTNQLTAEYASNLSKLADAEALVKNVQDDVVLGAERTLIAFGAQREELPKLVDAVIDLSTKTGDVAGAAFIVGKAIQGETGTLSRYGIFVDDAASKTEKLDSALEQIQARFGGQAAAAAATFSGRLGIVGIAVQQLQERLGQIITQNPVVLTALSGIAAGFTAAKDAIEVFVGPLDDAVSGLTALAVIKGADFFSGLADAAKDIPVLSAALRAFADGLRNSNTAALQAKANLAGISDVVAQGATGAARFVGIVREIGPTGQAVFRTIGAAISEAAGSLKTLTDTLANADTKLGPLETIGNKIGAKLKEQLPAVEDALVNFAIRVGEKMAVELAKAVGRGLVNATDAAFAETDRRQQKAVDDLNTRADESMAVWGKLFDFIAKGLTPSEAGAAEIPPLKLEADPSQAQASVDALQTDAEKPLTTVLNVVTDAADASILGLFTRAIAGAKLLGGALEQALIGAGRVAAGAGTGAVAGAGAGAGASPAPSIAPDRTQAGKDALAAAVAADAAMTAQLATQKQLTAEQQAAIDLETKRVALIDAATTKLNAEFEVLAKGVNELNPDVHLNLDTAGARTQAADFAQELARFKEINPEAKFTLDTSEAAAKAETLEQRIARLDGMAATVTLGADTKPLSKAEAQVKDLQETARTPTEIKIDTTKARGSFSVMQSTVDDISLKAQKGFSFGADISRVSEKLGIIRSDISAGVDPITIDAEISGVQKGIDKAREEIKTLDSDAQITATIKLDKQQAELDDAKLKNKIEQPATKPVDADTQAALAKVAELQAAAERAIGAVAHGFGEIHGQAATSADIQQTIDRLRQDLVAAIEAGDVAAQARLRAGGAEFIRTFQPTGGITSAEAKQIRDIIGFTAGGQNILAQFVARANSLTDVDPAIAQATRTAAEKTAEQQGETNSLLRENNQLQRETLNAARASAFGAQSAGALINQLARQSAAQATGNRNAGSGSFTSGRG